MLLLVHLSLQLFKLRPLLLDHDSHQKDFVKFTSFILCKQYCLEEVFHKFSLSRIELINMPKPILYGKNNLFIRDKMAYEAKILLKSENNSLSTYCRGNIKRLFVIFLLKQVNNASLSHLFHNFLSLLIHMSCTAL